MLLLAALFGAAGGGCSWIDEQERDCPETISVTCTLNLVSNKEEEMDDMLGSEHDRPVRAALEDYLTGVFVRSVHDVDLLFYDQRRRGKMILHQTEVMDVEQSVFSLQLPASDYRVGGVANRSAIPALSLENEESEYTLALVQGLSEQSYAHPTAVFGARKRMLVRDQSEEQRYEVNFSMANAAAALIINRDSCDVKRFWATYEGLADSFRVVDSAYRFDRRALVKTDVIDVAPFTGSDSDDSVETDTGSWIFDSFWTRWNKTPLMVCGVGFPSPTMSSEIIGTFSKIWTINLYVTLQDESTTLSQIYIGKPLNAGHLLIVKGWLRADGSFTATPEHAPYNPDPGGPDNPEPGPEPPVPPEPATDSIVAGVHILINWTPGAQYNPDFE